MNRRRFIRTLTGVVVAPYGALSFKPTKVVWEINWIGDPSPGFYQWAFVQTMFHGRSVIDTAETFDPTKLPNEVYTSPEYVEKVRNDLPLAEEFGQPPMRKVDPYPWLKE